MTVATLVYQHLNAEPKTAFEIQHELGVDDLREVTAALNDLRARGMAVMTVPPKSPALWEATP